MQEHLVPAAVFILTALCTGGLLAALYYPRAGRDPFAMRASRIAGRQLRAGIPAEDEEARGRRRSVERTIREIESKQRPAAASRRSRLRSILRQAGLQISPNAYHGVRAACAAAALAAALAAGLPFLAALAAAAGGMFVPCLYVRRRRARRLARFEWEFADAVDVMGRGLRAGLPLPDCLRTVAAQAAEPVRGEFALVVQDVMLGVPVGEAAERLALRVPIAEAGFFATVVASQSRAGGSLSEALSNLSSVLRDRKKLRGRVRAASSEAVSSAGIIAALPIAVTGLVWLASPDYVALLFTTGAGNAALAASAAWMAIGAAVMRRMINFEY